jgi:hypothetical protein
VEPEFTRMMVRVIAVGLFLGGVGTVALVLAFRAFAGEQPRDMRGSLWIAAVLFLVLVGCLILLRFSFVRQ